MKGEMIDKFFVRFEGMECRMIVVLVSGGGFVMEYCDCGGLLLCVDEVNVLKVK